MGFNIHTGSTLSLGRLLISFSALGLQRIDELISMPTTLQPLSHVGSCLARMTPQLITLRQQIEALQNAIKNVAVLRPVAVATCIADSRGRWLISPHGCYRSIIAALPGLIIYSAPVVSRQITTPQPHHPTPSEDHPRGFLHEVGQCSFGLKLASALSRRLGGAIPCF